jgi:hypothetical protein
VTPARRAPGRRAARRERRTATYVYGVARSRRPPGLARAPRGLPGLGRPRLLDAGEGLWLVVASAPLARYGEAPLERALADLEWVSAVAVGHAAVIAHVARTATVVPMKLFTLFGEDERALLHLRARRGRLERLLARVAGRREWGVRLSLASRTAPAGGAPARAGARRGAGTRFLLRKRALQDADRRVRARGEAEARGVFQALRRTAVEARRRPIVHAGAGPRVLLDAAFLVSTVDTRRFRAGVRAAAGRAARAGYALTLTGPWPPYTFVSERL